MLMSKKTILQCLSRLIVAATFVLSVAKPASAQYGMDFSIYADFAFDGLTVYGDDPIQWTGKLSRSA